VLTAAASIFFIGILNGKGLAGEHILFPSMELANQDWATEIFERTWNKPTELSFQATRLSTWDPWLSVTTLQWIWLYSG